jgi:hypothetical protein
MAAKNGKDYFQLILDFYNSSGLKKSSTLLKKFVSVYVLYSSLVIFYFMVIFNLRYKHSDIFDFADVFNSLFGFGHVHGFSVFYVLIHIIFQVICRKTLLLLHGSLFEEIMKEYSRFWGYDLFGTPTKNKFEKQMAFCLSIIKLLLAGGAVSVVVHSTAPIYTGQYLPHPCWIPGNNFIARVVLYGLEVIFYVELVFYMVVFDGFYLLMCSNLQIQFALLGKAVRSIRLGANATKAHEEVCWKKLKEFSQYHKFLLT